MKYIGPINLVLGVVIFIITAIHYWLIPDSQWAVTRALIDAAVAALCIGTYQVGRHRYFYAEDPPAREDADDDVRVDGAALVHVHVR